MQQINLYQAQFKPKPVIFPPRTLLIVCVLVLAVLTTISLYLDQRNRTLQNLIGQMEQQHSSQFSLSVDTPLLDAQLEQLQQQNQTQQQLLAYLSHHHFGNKSGFSAMLEDLANYRIEGVWLTDFSFTHGGQFLTIQGYALRSDLVPRYIDNLAKATSFKGKAFTLFKMSQPDNAQHHYQFSLRTDQALPEQE